MAFNQSRYSDVRDAYFSGGRPPPIPPKEEKRFSNEYSCERKFSSPSSSPHHSRSARPPSQPTSSHTHYNEYSHSVPRSHSKPPNQGAGVPQKGRMSGSSKALDRAGSSVVRSGSSSYSSDSAPLSPETPPSIPPRPVVISSVQKTFKPKKPTFLTDDMSFDYLIRHHQKSFPLRVYITNGYLGATSRLTISTGDMYNIHFVKRTRVMLFRDHHDIPYSIPLNSAIEFGLLYEPKEGRKPTDVETGVIFSSVGDLLAQPATPKVVAVLKSWQGRDGKISLLMNEVLIIKNVQRTVFAKKGIRVFSLTTKSDKFLNEDCSAQFSTQPALCRLHITDIMENIKQPKGAQCVLFLNSQVLMNRELSTTMQAIPDDLFDKVLTIIDQVTETSLIASSFLRRELAASTDDYDPDRDVLFDIPVDDNTAEMTCAVVQMEDTNQLYDNTKTLYEKFDPTRVMSVKDTGSEDSHAAQKLLYVTIRRGCEGLGVEIDRPERIYDVIRSKQHQEQQLLTPPPSASHSPSLSTHSPSPSPSLATSSRLPRSNQSTGYAGQDDLEDSPGYDDITPESLQLMHQRQIPHPHTVARGNSQEASKLDCRVVELECQLQQSGSQVASLHSKLQQGMGRVGELESELSRLKTTVEKLLPQIYALQSRLTHITNSPQRQRAVEEEEEEEEEGEKATFERNKKHLKTLTSQEVCQLLDAMDLGQYKDNFSRESVSGEILLECDDDILQCDLGVVSRLHRVRLMKVVDGRHSAACLIEGADPYVTLGTSNS